MSLPPGAPKSGAASLLSDAEFHARSGAMLSRIEAACDRWLQDDVVDIDTQRTGGLLEMAFPNGSKIVVNTQPPLHELWLAARDGGFHYRWDGEAWRDTRDGSEFVATLSRLASAQAGRGLAF
jgi:CyaY protein